MSDSHIMAVIISNIFIAAGIDSRPAKLVFACIWMGVAYFGVI